MINFVETWQRYALATDALRWYYQKGAPAMQDGGALLAGASASFLNAKVPARDRIRLGFWHECRKRPPTVTNSSFLHLLSGGDMNTANHVGLGMNPDGTISVFSGRNFSGLGGVTLGSGSTVLPLNDRHWIELDVLVHASAGSVELRLNGAPEFAVAGVRTSNPLLKQVIDRVSICGGANVSAHWFGGLYVGDGAEGWIGPAEFPDKPVSVVLGDYVAAPSIETMRPL